MKTTWTRPTIAHEFAHALVQAACVAAEERGKTVVIAVVDEGGVLKALGRMDGARPSSVQVAIDKAHTSTSGRPTHLWHEVLNNDPVLGAGARFAIDRLVTLGGGYPVVFDGSLVGAVGVAGGHYSDDMAVATAALADVGAKSQW